MRGAHPFGVMEITTRVGGSI
ncbi:hypothetical protein RHCRD62_70205 [Rhodococcus sp. RD6.2]|nr:hypothetical protein RHCRD62_70205 [Rhodococcus sp. RD6.2]